MDTIKIPESSYFFYASLLDLKTIAEIVIVITIVIQGIKVMKNKTINMILTAEINHTEIKSIVGDPDIIILEQVIFRSKNLINIRMNGEKNINNKNQ